LHVEEDDFLPEAVVVLSPDDVLAAVFQLRAVYYEVEVVASISVQQQSYLSPTNKTLGGKDEDLSIDIIFYFNK
jgi:hypothetical protein